MKPLIGITACLEEEKSYKTGSSYVKAVLRAGGVPVLLPCAAGPEACKQLVNTVDGILIPGGVDSAPQLFGEEPLPQVSCMDGDLDRFELELIHRATDMGKPILAICRGCQIINIAFGGTLYQDIPSQLPEAQGHYQQTASRSEPYHMVSILPKTALAAALGEGELVTNSFHHQAVKRLAEGFRVCARTRDGIIEGIENSDGSILGVQWHPECMEERFPRFQRLFCAFIERAAKRP
ncbi:MAG: gamma-glutamyl-gamma-aminobutyrate hydrolase family protein [Provencibacterium sp.]|nr:gamma-glutamyl-gamma-aminobutyrate hydrolase family protein [Provencibacterium sp.]